MGSATGKSRGCEPFFAGREETMEKIPMTAAGFKVHTVGDCNGVGYIEGAIAGAADVAVAIH